MTLGELIDFLYGHPYFVSCYFIGIPLAAFLAKLLGKGEGHLSPWSYFYSVLIYLSVIPGIFALLLNVYHLLYENTSIYKVRLPVQVVPIASMILSLYLIKQNVSFDKIPGFGKLSSFAFSMAGIMIILFILNKARILIFTYLPFFWLILILVMIYVGFRYVGKRITKSK